MKENSERQNDVVYNGQHLTLLSQGGWEFVRRAKATGVVGIIALTDQQELVLVEQFRRPVSARVLELPAGLVGDLSPETFEEAARRELLEETGYLAESIEFLFKGPSSAGLTDEVVHILRAKGLSKTENGGGVDGEEIIVHTVPFKNLDDFTHHFEKTHGMVDFKVRLASYLVKGDQ